MAARLGWEILLLTRLKQIRPTPDVIGVGAGNFSTYRVGSRERPEKWIVFI